MPIESIAVGVDIGGTAVKAGLVDTSGTVLDRVEHPTDPAAATKTTIGVVEHILERAREIDRVPVAVGIGAAGFVDVKKGAVTFSPNLVYDDPDLADAVSARVGLPTMVDNDANAAVWGEYTFGAAHGMRNVALVILGTGVGSGFIVNGRILRGHTGAAAELGHTVVDPGGPPCGCGLRGCLEQFVSGQAIARLAKEAVAEDPESSIVSFAGSVDEINAVHVARAARQLDETGRTVLRGVGRMLGLGLSNVANIFDPEVIILAGSVVEAGEPLLGPARDELVRLTQAQRRRPMRLSVSGLEAEAGIIGAAALAVDELSRGGADRDPDKESPR